MGVFFGLMGPVRGLKKRRKIEKKPKENASGSSEKERSVDWWDELSKRMNGIFFYSFIRSLYQTFVLCLLFLFKTALFACGVLIMLFALVDHSRHGRYLNFCWQLIDFQFMG